MFIRTLKVTVITGNKEIPLYRRGCSISCKVLILILLVSACAQQNTVNTPPVSISDSIESDMAADSAGEESSIDVEETDSWIPIPEPMPTVIEDAPARIVAMGDFHGDEVAMETALQIAGVIDEEANWIGGETALVQLGDQLDREDGERIILDTLIRLRNESLEAGGGVYFLLGNHELMNVEEDFRYVTEGGWYAFADVPYDDQDPTLLEYEGIQRGRVSAFRPAGVYARQLAPNNVVMVIGETLFVHGGILPEHVEYGLENINMEVRAWLNGEDEEPDVIGGDNSPVWSRHYSDDPDEEDCALLAETLDALGIERMVVAHTVHLTDIESACEELVSKVDVGMSSFYGGTPQVLEITGDAINILE